MRSFRLFGATCVLLCMLTGAMLPPLHALLLVPQLRRLASAKHAATAAFSPGGTAPVAAAAARWQTRWDAQGGVRRLYLPAADGLVGTWDERARQLLQAFPGVQATDVTTLQTVAVRRSPSGVSVRLQQQVSGVPLWGAEAVVSFANDARPLLVASELQPSPPSDQKPAAGLSQQEVLRRAARAVGMQGAALAPPRADLLWRQWGTAWRLTWRVRLVCAHPSGDWQVWVDAQNGSVLEWTDRTVQAQRPQDPLTRATATARVFLPDPVTASGDRSLRDQDDADAAVPETAYSLVTLHGLDAAKAGLLSLRGEFVQVVDWESPSVAPVTSMQPSFVYERSNSGFEDVMVYHHIDTMQRWYQSLGFADANNRPQPADAHGFWGEDNSKYLPTLGWLSFGEGGVDDAEDAAVIVHEYGHATQYDIVPTWGIGGHTAAMGEGFGDYLANSYVYALQPQRALDWNGVFQWDGHNEFWPGRKVVDPTLHYPENASGSAHAAGTLWCSALTDALYLLGDRALMDQLVLNHHYLLTGNATMEDAANAILLSDVAIHDGAHVAALTEVFQRWGMLDAAAARPVLMLHEPPGLADAAESLPDVDVRLVAIDAASEPRRVVLHTRDENGNVGQWPMQSLGGDRWRGVLPGAPGTDVVWRYWFESVDALGRSLQFPEAAEGAAYEFVMGQVAEDFESSSDWQVQDGTPAATHGQWVRTVPVGTAWQPTRDHSTSGSSCWVTGNALPGAPASDADVDDGGTLLLSPIWDVSDAATLVLRYWRWFASNSASQEDLWRVQASGDGGQSWIVLEEATQGDPGWQLREFDLAPRLPGAQTLQLRFLVADRGAGSLVEAAVDDVVLRMKRATNVATAPVAVSLGAHPNPFNPATTVSFAAPAPTSVQLDVYDLRGRHVRRLFDGPGAAATRQIVWDGRDGAGRRLASGMYLLRLRNGSTTTTCKVTLLR